MKHAYLIMAHQDIYLLKILVELIDNENNDIYIHFDSKSDFNINSKSFNLKYSNIYFMDRMDVRWADISQVKCELNLFKMAVNKGYDYYHLLSGADLPLKTQNQIHDFFAENKGKEFVHFSNKNDDLLFYNFVSKYHFFQKKLTRSNFSAIKIFNKISLLIQDFLHIDRVKKMKLNIKKGSNWVSITNEFVNFLLSKEEYILDIFRWTKSPDEFFIQTLISNSYFKNRIYLLKYDDNYFACLRKIDWNRGTPYTYHIEDYEDLMNSNYLFARKFNSTVDREIIDKISLTLKVNNNT